MQFNKETISLLIRTIKNYGWMDLPSYGTSMYPFIQKGNVCRFTAFNSKDVRKGDILLYYTNCGQLIAHRFIRVKNCNGELTFELKGDTNLCHDEPIFQEQIIGKLVKIHRNKKLIYMDDFSAIMWSYIITSVPITSKLLKTYLSCKEHLKTGSGISV